MANDPIGSAVTVTRGVRSRIPVRSLPEAAPRSTFDRGDRHMADASALAGRSMSDRAPLEILQRHKDVAGHRLASRGRFDAARKTLRTAARRPRLQASGSGG